MKIRLNVRKEKYKTIEEELHEHNIEINDHADLVLSEANREEEPIICKSDDENIPVYIDDIVYAESLGHEVWVHTMNGKYRYMNRLYQLEDILPTRQYVRISKSVIINISMVTSIKSALSQKFLVTMKNGVKVDVTRNYYYQFKCVFKI